jgi:dipeptide/tripeptide permease
VSGNPSERQLEMQSNIFRQESGDRRTIMRVQMAAGLVLVASTLFGWENHPKMLYRGGSSPEYFVREVGHSFGLATMPAGFLILAIGLLALACATRLKQGHTSIGWVNLALALGAIGVLVIEIVQLFLGRRNWLDNFSNATAHMNSPLANAVGAGVWIATAASAVLVANALRYVWLSHRLWNVAPPYQGAARQPR